MKKIIDGRMYNTETAKVIAYNSNNLPKSELEYCMETLYRKRNGEYFLHGDGGAYSPYNRCVQGHLCGDEKIIPLCEEEAIKKANTEFGSLSNYCGMGGYDKLLGVNTPENDRCIYPDSDVEFDDVLPFTE